jgi:hypothetical protein
VADDEQFQGLSARYKAAPFIRLNVRHVLVAQLSCGVTARGGEVGYMVMKWGNV